MARPRQPERAWKPPERPQTDWPPSLCGRSAVGAARPRPATPIFPPRRAWLGETPAPRDEPRGAGRLLWLPPQLPLPGLPGPERLQTPCVRSTAQSGLLAPAPSDPCLIQVFRKEGPGRRCGEDDRGREAAWAAGAAPTRRDGSESGTEAPGRGRGHSQNGCACSEAGSEWRTVFPIAHRPASGLRQVRPTGQSQREGGPGASTRPAMPSLGPASGLGEAPPRPGL